MERVPLNWGEQRYVIWTINAYFSNFVRTKSWPGLKSYIMDQKFLERRNGFCLSVKMTNPETAFCYCFWGQCWEKGPETSNWMNSIPPFQGVDNLGHNLALIVLDFFFPIHWYMQREWRGGVINKSIVLNAGSLSLKGILSCLIPWGIFHCWLTQEASFLIPRV